MNNPRNILVLSLITLGAGVAKVQTADAQNPSLISHKLTETVAVSLPADWTWGLPSAQRIASTDSLLQLSTDANVRTGLTSAGLVTLMVATDGTRRANLNVKANPNAALGGFDGADPASLQQLETGLCQAFRSTAIPARACGPIETDQLAGHTILVLPLETVDSVQGPRRSWVVLSQGTGRLYTLTVSTTSARLAADRPLMQAIWRSQKIE